MRWEFSREFTNRWEGVSGETRSGRNPSAGDGECFFGAKTVPTPFQEGLRRLTCDFVATLLLILLASFSQEGPSRNQDGRRRSKRLPRPPQNGPGGSQEWILMDS